MDGWSTYIDVLSWAQKIAIQSSIDYFECRLAGAAWLVIVTCHLPIIKQATNRANSTSYRFLGSIVMANSALIIQKAVLLKTEPFPIQRHALAAASAQRSAISYIRGIK